MLGCATAQEYQSSIPCQVKKQNKIKSILVFIQKLEVAQTNIQPPSSPGSTLLLLPRSAAGRSSQRQALNVATQTPISTAPQAPRRCHQDADTGCISLEEICQPQAMEGHYRRHSAVAVREASTSGRKKVRCRVTSTLPLGQKYSCGAALMFED